MNRDYPNRKPKCGIVTFHSAHNYGSVLQSYAMVMTMRKLGTDAELIDFRHPHTTDAYEWRLWTPYKNWRWNLKDILLRGIMGIGKDRERVFGDFIDNKLPKSERISGCKEIFPAQYDVLVCGSDQIWNPVSTGENDPIYFLDFGDTACKFSYAASAGSSKFPQQEHDRYARCLKNLKSIGVREQFLHDYLKEEFGLESVVNPDPTLLLNVDEWAGLETEYSKVPGQYLLVYTLAKVDETLAFARQVGTKLGLPVVQICNTRGFKTKSKKNVDYNVTDASPQQFLWLFHHASFIVTNTFHGNMFSVIFRKDFVHYDVNGNDSRITTLHEAIGLKKTRMIKNVDALTERQIDYQRIESLINAYANKGIEYIKANLNSNE